MIKTIQINDITINIGDKPVNCDGFEEEVLVAIDELNNAKVVESADLAFTKIVDFYKRNVLFPSKFMFFVSKSPNSKLPSLKTILSLLKGANDLLEEIKVNTKDFDSDYRSLGYFRRAIINLSISNTLANLIIMPPSVFSVIINTWKNESGVFHKWASSSPNQIYSFNKIAQALNRLNNNASYEMAVKQPRSDSTFRRPDGPEFILANPNDNNKEWIELFNEWLNGQNLKSTKRQKRSIVVLLDWIKTYPEDIAIAPLRFLSAPRTNPSLIDFIKNGGESISKDGLILTGYIYRFTQWIIDSYMRELDDDGEVTLGHTVLSFSDHQLMQGAWVDSNRPFETTSRPLPTAWRQKVLTILTENDYAWPKSLKSQYFDWKNPETNQYECIWVPTLTYLFETMLELPLRRIQCLCLDSGEGDEHLYDPATGEWVKNTCIAAEYWKNDPSAKVIQRGVIKDFSKPGKPLVGFYINTNKTADKKAPDGEKAGYAIPWQNETVIRVFSNLREWQQKYNPKTTPTPYSSVSTRVFGYDPTETALKSTPDRFYLFRTPVKGRGNDSSHPPSTGQCQHFWYELMAKLEQVLREEGEDEVIVLNHNKVTGQPGKSYYNIHGLRVATLTAFAEVGVPIEILSKIVAGHATILMTIYYLKFEEASISQLLCEKAIEIKGNAADQLKRHLENKSWENAKRIAVYNDEENFRSIMSSGFSPLWSNEGYGLCPHGGTRCDDGGPILRKNGKSPLYGPVQGGKHNCLRCRHFISGTPFLMQMWMKTNKLLADSQKMSIEYDNFVSELKQLEDQKYHLIKSGRKTDISGKMVARIKELEGICDMRGNYLNETLLDLHSAWRFTESIKVLFSHDESANENLPALLSANNADFDFNYREGTRFESISYILQASRIYPFLEDENLELERERFLDTILLRENLMPLCLAPLTKEEKRMAADAASLFLLTKVDAEEIQMVYEGKISLKDLGLNGDLSMAMKGVSPQLTEYRTTCLTNEIAYG